MRRLWGVLFVVVSAELHIDTGVAAVPMNLYTYTVPVGQAGAALADAVFFDGESMWISGEDHSGGWVAKLGSHLEVIFWTSVGASPLGMAFDGNNMWVTGYTSSDLTVVNGGGQVVKRFQLAKGSNPEGIAFDGKYVWVANNGVGNNTISKFDANTMTLVGAYPVGRSPDGITFDGSKLWVTNSLDNTVSIVDRATGQVLRSLPTGAFPLSVVFDGSAIWVAGGAGEGSLQKIRLYGEIELGSFPVGLNVRGLAVVGSTVWACNSGSNTVSQIRISDGTRLGTYAVGPSPRAVAFDGTSLWVTNSGNNTVTVLTPSSVPPVKQLRTPALPSARGGTIVTPLVNLDSLGPASAMLDGTPMDGSPIAVRRNGTDLSALGALSGILTGLLDDN